MKLTTRRCTMLASATIATLSLAACGSSGSAKPAAGAGSSAPSGANLQMMIASSGPAELASVKSAAAAWGTKTGNKVTVINASDLPQQLTQAFAGGSPPDIFYGSAGQFQSLAKSGALAETGSKIDNSADFYPSLSKTFTVKGKYYCAPKDFSTLALEINTDLWTKAGLTDADVPTTWDQLEADAKKLTSGKVTGLVVGDTLDRVGAFMAAAGGGYMNADQTGFTFDSSANLQGLTYVQKLAKEGVLKFPKQVSAGWGGEAFGKGLAAMTVEGNWVVGAMKTDYPTTKYKVVELPAGPTGKKGTLSFTNCWGVSEKSKNSAADISFVDYLTSTAQQVSFAKDFGVMPSRASAKSGFVAALPGQQAFVNGADYALGPVTLPGFSDVQKAFDADVINLGTSSDPKTMLSGLQTNSATLIN